MHNYLHHNNFKYSLNTILELIVKNSVIMKLSLVFVGILAVAVAQPIDDSKNAQIIKYESDNIGIDGYKFSYETSDGVKRTEEAVLKNPGTENEALVVTGSISWIGADGETYTINFVADENGFRPEGAHLPK